MKSMNFAFCLVSFFSFMFFTCSAQEIKNVKEQLKKEPGMVIDVRTNAEFQSGHYRFAQNMDWNGGVFQNNIDKLDKNKTYYLYCAAGGRSSQAAEFMKQKGFKKVYNLGGYSNMPKD